MGLLDRWRRPGGGRARPGTTRAAGAEDKDHLVDFVRSHTGVEAYVEPPTAVTTVTVLLVAGSGEWTRRRAPSAEAVHRLANDLGIPSYDAAVVGYPQRMRDWNARRKIEERRRREATGEL